MKLKRVVALLMALCMMMGLVPVAAFATEREEHPIIERDTFVTVNIENGGDIAYFRFAPEYTESYTFYSVGDYDTFGYLYDSEMNLLKGNDVGGSDDNFSITYDLEAGKNYILAARFYSNTATGAFDVQLQANHGWESEVLNHADCTTPGLMGHTCTICGKYFTEEISVCHDYESQVTIAPTCAVVGERTYTCTLCGDQYTEEIPLLNHTYDEGTVVAPYTCTQDGQIQFTCTACGHADLRKTFAAHTLAENSQECALCGEGCLTSGTCGTNAKWALYKDGTLVIFGTGGMYNSERGGQPWYEFENIIKTVVIQIGVTSIGADAFSYCSSLVSIDLPESLTSIGCEAFFNCSSLTSIDLPDSMTSIGQNAFYNCSSLASIDLPEGMTSIDDDTFNNCSSLESIDLPDSLTSIGSYAFYNCSSLTSIVLPDSLTSISNYAFRYCSNLSTVFYRGTEEQRYTISIGSDNSELTSAQWHYEVADATYEGQPAYLCGKCGHYFAPDGTRLSCEHAYTAVVVEPTCTEKGYTTYTCSCGDTYTEELAALGHYVLQGFYTVENDATYPFTIEDGWYVSSNKSHNSTSTFTIRAVSDGELILQYKVSSESGCDILSISVNGTTIHTISGEQDWSRSMDLAAGDTVHISYSKDGSVSNGADEGYFKIEPNMQMVSSDEIEPTCEDAVVCESCKQVIKAALGHIEVVDAGYAATCTEDGLTEGSHCDRCNTVFVSQEVIPAGHSWDDGAVTKQPTFEETGIRVCNCTTCGETKTEEIPMLLGGKCGENLNWELDGEGTLTISGTGKMYKWTSKSPPPWYSHREKIKTIVVEDGAVAIRAFAFAHCSQLTSVNLPGSITAIGNRAFYKCRSLTSIEIPDSVKSIAEKAFASCSSLVSVEIPDNVRSIGNYAFSECSNLTSINLPDSVRSLREGVFYYCSSLTSIDLPDRMTSIGYWTFYNCSSLTSVDIPDSVKSIGDYAFCYCYSLSSIDLSDRLTSIGYRVFYNCSNLASIDIPDSVTSIGEYAFSYCSSLVSINLPDSLNSIGYNAFYNCSSLSSIDFPNGVTSIGNSAFAYCNGLTEITFTGNDPSISNNTFYNVTSTVYYPVGNSTWTDSVTNNYGGSLTWIGKWMDPGGKCGKNLIWALDEDGLLSISGTGKMYNWNSYAEVPWYGYREMIKTVVLEEGVSSIGNYAFYNCSSTVSVDLPDGITSIGNYAFSNCSKLKSIELENSVTSIGSYAFGNCSSLTEISFSGNVPSFESNVFANVTATVYYPAGNSLWSSSVKKNYGGSLTWIEKWMDPSGKCGENLTWTLDEDGLLTISGTGKMDNWNSEYKIPWYGYREMIKTVVLEEGVSSIGHYAFYECSSLTRVGLPDSLISIGYYAFSNCSNLVSIDLPDSVTSIGSYAFKNCSSLTSINLPDSLTSIGEWAFVKCSSLVSIDIPEGITSIRYSTFSGCSGLVSVDLPESLRKISYSAFAGCSSLTNLDLPDGITSIGESAFIDCSSLTSITLPASLTYVDYALFTNCSSLTSIYLPAGITAISERAFFGCSSVTNINFAGDAPRIGYEAFYNVTANAYYPAGNDTWTHAAKQNYGGNLTWIAACPDHQYADPAYIWSDDFVSCTATRSCINPQCEEVKREKVRASIETRAATCEEEGKTVYIVMFTSDVFTTQTKERSIPALGHDCSYTVTAEPDLANTGRITGICSRCSQQTEVELPCLNVEDYAYEVTLEPTLTQLGTGVYTWKETAYGTFRFTVTLDKLAPELEKLTVATNPDKTVYRLGEAVDVTGLTLTGTYSDGEVKTITSGYRVSSLDSSTPGEKTVTVTYEGRSTAFQVTVQPMTETDPQIVVSNSKGVLGYRVNVTVSLKNNPGITSMLLEVGYDPEVLELVSVTDAGKLGEAGHSDNYGRNPYVLSWENDLAKEDYVVDGEIVTLTFQVAEDAPVGETPVTVSYTCDNYDIFNAAGENVWFATVNGSVNVTDVLLGDVNSDGMVNGEDRLVLTRYLAKWTDYPESVINMAAADVNCDGKVNAQDRLILARHLAAWTGYETLGA